MFLQRASGAFGRETSSEGSQGPGIVHGEPAPPRKRMDRFTGGSGPRFLRFRGRSTGIGTGGLGDRRRMIEIKVQLFGLFRKFGNGSEVNVAVPVGATLDDIRERFKEELARSAGEAWSPDWIQGAAFANEERVLDS